MKNKKTDKNKKEDDFPKGLNTPLDSSIPENIFSDVNGSYTGHPIDNGLPVQDADDL